MAFRDRLSMVEQRFGSSRRQVSARARWRTRARPPMVRPGDGLIRVDPGLVEQIRGFMDAIAPQVSIAFNRQFVPFAERTYQAWPVKTGLSRSLLTLSFRPLNAGQAFAGDLINAAPYAGYIRPGKQSANRRPLVRQLFADGELVAELVALDIKRQMGG